MRKSSDRKSHYRPGTSRNRGSTASFREQMADYAKGDVLRELRSNKRMSREDVAHAVGVTPKSLYAWEKTNSAIKWENAKRLARFYDVEPDSLVTRDADEAAGLPSRAQMDRIENQVIKNGRLLNALLIQLLGDDEETMQILLTAAETTAADNAEPADATEEDASAPERGNARNGPPPGP